MGRDAKNARIDLEAKCTSLASERKPIVLLPGAGRAYRMGRLEAPGPFEPDMPDIAEWFRNRSPADSNTE